MASDPIVTEHELTPQGRIYKRAADTDEKLQDIAPDFKGSGATPQEKSDETKGWISQEHTTASVDDASSTRPKPDTYAQELNKRLGPLSSVMDTLADGLDAAKERVSGSSKAPVAETAGETQNSAAGTISQYTQAALDKMNDLKPTLGGAKEPDAMESKLDETKQQAAEIAEKTKEGTSDVSLKLLAAGGDDVMKVLSDGGSTQEDPLKANMRVTTEMLA